MVLFLVISAVAGMFVFHQVRRYIASSDTLPSFSNPAAGDSEVGNQTPDPTNLEAVWTGKERVNILLIGIDRRPGEEGAFRTDTMLVLTLDPVTKTGGVLSIPRDLWVPIPGYRVDRINIAHALGQRDDYPGGGPALAVKTVENNLGIPIHYHVRVDFKAFVELVDRIGGIDIYVEQEIDDPTYPSHDPADPYGYDPLHIEPGQHHFDGDMALKYARTRHTAGSDFDRADRQQAVLRAIFKKVTSLNMLPTLIAQEPGMWRTLEGSVETNLTLDQIIALARLASQVEPDDIHYGAIDERYTLPYVTEDGAEVLILIRDRMRELRDELFTTETASDEEGSESGSQLEEEAASIEVLNGTLTAGLAADVTELLREENLDVVHTGNADRQDVDETLVVSHTDKAFTAQYIASVLNLPQTAVVQGSEPAAEYDISVILGADYPPPQ
ncbi:MAG: LCP family protein [Anaerolineae bacterium]|jgi:LCP family protein required for cell wall assembly